jgi:hypothetical protein
MGILTSRYPSSGAGLRLLTGVLGASLLLSACGSSAATSAPSSAPGTAASSAASTAPTDAATSEPTDAAATDAATPAAGSLDACALIPVADVKTITGADVTAAIDPNAKPLDWAAGECRWSNTDFSVDFALSFGTKDSIAKSDTGKTVAEQLPVTKAVYAVMGTVKDEPGLGDTAFYSGGFLFVAKGDSMFQLYALQLKEPELVALAKVVLSHM